MTEDKPLNPVDIEASIQECSRRIHNGVTVVTNAEAQARAKDRDFDMAYARAYMAHQGPAHEKRYAATLDTENERADRDAAEVAFRFADRTAKAIEAELRACQSVGASVRAMYSGERGFGG